MLKRAKSFISGENRARKASSQQQQQVAVPHELPESTHLVRPNVMIRTELDPDLKSNSIKRRNNHPTTMLNNEFKSNNCILRNTPKRDNTKRYSLDVQHHLNQQHNYHHHHQHYHPQPQNNNQHHQQQQNHVAKKAEPPPSSHRISNYHPPTLINATTTSRRPERYFSAEQLDHIIIPTSTPKISHAQQTRQTKTTTKTVNQTNIKRQQQLALTKKGSNVDLRPQVRAAEQQGARETVLLATSVEKQRPLVGGNEGFFQRSKSFILGGSKRGKKRDSDRAKEKGEEMFSYVNFKR